MSGKVIRRTHACLVEFDHFWDIEARDMHPGCIWRCDDCGACWIVTGSHQFPSWRRMSKRQVRASGLNGEDGK